MSGVSIATGVIATDALGGGQGRGLQSPGVLAQSGVAVSITGTAVETTLATIPIPAGSVGLAGSLRITVHWSGTSSANNKIYKVLYGGSTIFTITQSTNSLTATQLVMHNRGIVNSQITYAGTAAGLGNSAGGNLITAVDSSVSQNLTITGTLVNTGETITLESYTVEILNS